MGGSTNIRENQMKGKQRTHSAFDLLIIISPHFPGWWFHCTLLLPSCGQSGEDDGKGEGGGRGVIDHQLTVSCGTDT